MKVNLTGTVDLLYSGAYKLEVTLTPYAPENVLYVYKMSFETILRIMCHPKNFEAASELVQSHNEIYNSPLARALRE